MAGENNTSTGIPDVPKLTFAPEKEEDFNFVFSIYQSNTICLSTGTLSLFSVLHATGKAFGLVGNSGLDSKEFQSEHVKKRVRVCIQGLVWPKYKSSISTEVRL